MVCAHPLLDRPFLPGPGAGQLAGPSHRGRPVGGPRGESGGCGRRWPGPTSTHLESPVGGRQDVGLGLKGQGVGWQNGKKGHGLAGAWAALLARHHGGCRMRLFVFYLRRRDGPARPGPARTLPPSSLAEPGGGAGGRRSLSTRRMDRACAVPGRCAGAGVDAGPARVMCRVDVVLGAFTVPGCAFTVLGGVYCAGWLVLRWVC
jgi:hypothetical protein